MSLGRMVCTNYIKVDVASLVASIPSDRTESSSSMADESEDKASSTEHESPYVCKATAKNGRRRKVLPLIPWKYLSTEEYSQCQ